jgi:glycosyltransferase involved in cell wall biosynthesis
MKPEPSHCIVTPDFIGPIRNGGIGTACYELARFLSTQGKARVTILFTSSVVVDSADKWSTYYREKHGWRFLSLSDLPPLPTISHHNSQWFSERSLQIHHWLRDQDFNQIHFQDWHANGFVPVQAKRAGVAYGNTFLTCAVHSPQEWSEEGNMLFPDGGIEPMLQRHCEKYAASHADVSIFPSRHMLEYVESKTWRIDHPVVVPYLFGREQQPSRNLAQKVTELCFFGRLETRKGLEVFVAALERLIATRGLAFLPKVTFLGKPGLVTSGESLDFLNDFQERCSIGISILSDLDAKQAQNYLKADPGRLAVIPSLLDNLPYVVIECLQNGTPVIASQIGGIPELIGSEDHLFRPNAKDLANRLEHILDQGCPPVESLYDLRKAEEWWKALSTSADQSKVERRSVDPAQITVCIAYYNYGEYLPDLLDSLEKQTVNGFGVAVVNDGSTDESSIRVFEEMQSKYADRPNWKFVTQNNGGIGVARNHAASLAETDYIVFMDADNLAKPQMIERMAVAMGTSRADCLTCYMEGFAERETGAVEVVYRYTPTGNCPEAGCFENIFGDANCIVRRDAFEEIGKFSLDRDSSFEDWEFLAKMSLNGKHLDVIPEFLHLYRHTDQGFSRNTSAFRNRRRILTAYQAHLPGWAGRLLECSYASVTDIKELTQPRSTLANLPSLTDAARRMARIASLRFDSAKYLSMYRSILKRRGGLTDWSKIPRIHYILFGNRFPI